MNPWTFQRLVQMGLPFLLFLGLWSYSSQAEAKPYQRFRVQHALPGVASIEQASAQHSQSRHRDSFAPGTKGTMAPLPLSYMGWWAKEGQSTRLAQIDPKTGLPPPVSESSVPPVEWPLVLLQGFSAVVVGAFGSFMVQALIDLALAPTIQTTADIETSGLVSNISTLLIMPWVIGATVYGLGQLSNNYTASFWWALAGAYVGQGVAFGVGLLLNYLDTSEKKNTSRLVRFLLDGLLIGVGSVLMYTLFRRSKGTFQQIGTLMRYQDGKVAWGLPIPLVTQPQPNETLVTVPILAGQF
ncbi:MAG: hypothetical protein EP343_14360 [Deltaproteobacteria bacterium]|nr:MAG: hypothetical protein EP343_14360 [Deltaproteobacteria bacterium]